MKKTTGFKSPFKIIICTKNAEEEGIGFQDGCDAFLLAMMPSCWEFKTDL